MAPSLLVSVLLIEGVIIIVAEDASQGVIQNIPKIVTAGVAIACQSICLR